MRKAMSVGEVAARSGVAVSALHFYESKGLIQSTRTSGNQRRYDGDVLRRVAIIRVAQELGVSLAEVSEALADLPHGQPAGKADWARISQGWKAKLDRRITLLARLRDDLEGCIGCGCLSLENCPIYNRDDQLGIEGDGPRLLLRRS